MVLTLNTENLYIASARAISLPEVKQPEPRPKIAVRAISTVTSGTRYGTAKLVYADNTNNCVTWVKNQTGIYRTLGNGARYAVQGTEPRVGAIGAVKGRPHAVLVKSIDGNMITIWESNYTRGWITERVLPLSLFIGFIYS